MHSGNERSTSTTENQTFPLAHLPHEILMNIFSALDLCDLAALRVNQHLNALLSDRVFWRSKFANHFPHLFHEKKSQPNTDWLLAFSAAYALEYCDLTRNKRAVKLFWLVIENATERLLPGGDFSLTVADLYLEAPETIPALDDNGKVSLVSWMRRKNNQTLLNHAYELILASWYDDEDEDDDKDDDEDEINNSLVWHLDRANRNTLHWAVQCCQPLEEIKRLVDLGAKIEKLDRNGHSPLHLAAEAGNVAIVKYLLDELQQNKQEEFLSENVICSNYGQRYRPFHSLLNTPLLLAAREGHSQIVELLLAHGAIVKDKEFYLTPLHLAAFNGDLDMVRLLLAKGANALATYSSVKLLDYELLIYSIRNPLHYAIENHHLAVVEALVQHVVAHSRSLLQLSSLEAIKTAFKRRDEAIVNLFCHHLTEDDFKSFYIYTILSYAISASFHKTTEALLKGGIRLTSPLIVGRSQLTHAIMVGNVDTIALLLEHSILSDEEKAFSLEDAIRIGKIEVVELLLQQGFSVAQVDFFIASALFTAALFGQAAIVALLLRHGAEPNALSESRYGGTMTALHVAAEEGYLDIFKILLAHGADINLTDSVGRQALQLVPADKAIAFSRVASKHLIDTYLADLTEKEERQSKQALGLFASTFTFGTSVREKRDAAEALIQVLIGEADISTLETHQRALNQGNLGRVYKKINEIYLSKLPPVATHSSSLQHN